MNKKALITIVALYLPVSAVAMLLVHKDGCIFNDRRGLINCRGEHWQNIPFYFMQDKSFHTLDLGVNNITSLSTNDNFMNLPFKNRIEVIYLDNNQISELPPHLFNALPSLRILDLSNNTLNHIPRRLCHMTHLTHLILDGNPIKSISKNAFVCLRNLKSLSLANCTINNLRVDFLKGSNLEQLDLFGNDIENIEEVVFPKSLQVYRGPQDSQIRKFNRELNEADEYRDEMN